MAKPPPTPPSSDLHGVNRNTRAGSPDADHADPGGAVQNAKAGSAARPEEGQVAGDEADAGAKE